MTAEQREYIPTVDEIKTKDGPKPYLKAHEAILWFRTKFPEPRSQIITHVFVEHSLLRAEIYVDGVLVSTGHSKGDGNKSLEKLETNAVRRALANLGYGTTHAIADEENWTTPLDATSEARVALSLRDVTVEDAKQQLAPAGGLNEKRIHRSAPPPAPTSEEEEPSPRQWPSQKGINWLCHHIDSTGLIKGATLPEIARLAGVKDPADMTALGWGKFATGQQAYNQIKFQWNRPPLSKKDDQTNGNGKSPQSGPLFAWTRDESQVRKFYDWSTKNFQYPDGKTDQALETITGHTLDQFPDTLHDAMAAILAHACDRDLSSVDDKCAGVNLTCDSQADRGQIHFAARKYCAESATEPEPAP